MKNKFVVIFIALILTGCGFTSGLYQDILAAQSFLDKHDYKAAAKKYEEILEKKPSKNVKIKINYQLGEIYSIYLNDYNKSLLHFKFIVDSSNEPAWQVRALEKIGEIYFENLKDYKHSLEIYQKLTNFTPPLLKQNEYNFKYAMSLLNGEKYTDSITYFNNIIQSSEQEFIVEAYYNKGLAHYFKKEWDEAINSWNEYLRREKRNDRKIKVRFMIANALESSEKLKEAYNYYYSILGEYPNPEVIRSRLNSLYERRVARKR